MDYLTKNVMIIGGGVAGLTAAHELAERGCRVVVVEKDKSDPVDSVADSPVALGGIARSQWAFWPMRFAGADGLVPPGSGAARIQPFFDPGSVLGAILKNRPRQGEPNRIMRLHRSRPFIVGPHVPISVGFVDRETSLDQRKPVFIHDVTPFDGVEIATARAAIQSVRQNLGRDVQLSNPELTAIAVETWTPPGATRDEAVAFLTRVIDEIAVANVDLLRFLVPLVHDSWLSPDSPRAPLTWPLSSQRNTTDLLADIASFASDLSSEAKETVSMDEPVTFTGTEQFYAVISVPQLVFPGEHGFRFFPSLYRHTFDTMKRTPIIERLPHEVGRTVYDNLVPSDVLALGVHPNIAPRRDSFEVPRRPLRSYEDVVRLLRHVLADTGYDPRDIALLSCKFARYLTSGKKRREAEYESMSWGDFVEVQRYAQRMSWDLENGPSMLAALRADQSDARTQGNMSVQLCIDQLQFRENRDSKLNGPTSTAWIRHWRNYLLSQGVTFRQGRITGFELDAAGKVLPKIVQDGAADLEAFNSDWFFVLALPLAPMWDLANQFRAAVAASTEPDKALYGGPTSAPVGPRSSDDFLRILDFWSPAPRPEDDLTAASPQGPLQHLSGIQFYFHEPVRVAGGHSLYLDSPWGLTSISQPQFWGRSRGPYDGYRDILSIDIGIFNVPGTHGGAITVPGAGGTSSTAWDEPNLDAIAREVWLQIVDSYSNKQVVNSGEWENAWPHFPKQGVIGSTGVVATIPYPAFYHLDDDIARRGGKVDHTGFLINRVGDYRKRPGDPIEGYKVHLGRFILAGTHMQTFTRVTSMESANESARHAVNAILRHPRAEYTGDFCRIWDPEENEIDDLQPLKDMDDRLFERGEPHVADILEAEEWVNLLP